MTAKFFVSALLTVVALNFSATAFANGWPKIPKPAGPTPPKMILAHFPLTPRPGPVVPPPLHILNSEAVARISCVDPGSNQVMESVAVFSPADVQEFSVIAADSHTVSIQSEAIDRAQSASCKIELSAQDLAAKSETIAL